MRNHFAVEKCASLPPTAVNPSLSAVSRARSIFHVRVLAVQHLDRADRRAVARDQRVQTRAESRLAERMRRNRNAAFVMNHIDQMLAAEHPRGQVESARHLVIDAVK